MHVFFQILTQLCFQIINRCRLVLEYPQSIFRFLYVITQSAAYQIYDDQDYYNSHLLNLKLVFFPVLKFLKAITKCHREIRCAILSIKGLKGFQETDMLE